MNKVYSIATLALGLFVMGLSGCAQKEDNIFDTSVNERVEEEVQKLSKLLVSSTEGWILDYIPGGTQQYGGYYIGLKFSDKGEALATNDMLTGSGSLWHKSQYVVGKDKSISINFDTYNEGIHYFTTPDRSYAGGISLGFEGDHEFTLVKIISDNEIQVRGKKTRNLMTLRRATTSIDDFMASIRAMRARIFNKVDMDREHQDALEGTLGGKRQLAKLDNTGLNYYTVTTEGVDGSTKVSYFVTPTGIRFVKPIEGVTELTWQNNRLTSSNGDLVARRDPYYDSYAAYLGEYTLTSAGGGSYNVEFVEAGYNTYTITGLPFNLTATYDTAKDRFAINCQILEKSDARGNVWLSVWAAPNGTALNWGEDRGMVSSYVANSQPKRYTMYDNGKGVWGENKAHSFILWSDKNGVNEAPIGGLSRIESPVFTRRN